MHAEDEEDEEANGVDIPLGTKGEGCGSSWQSKISLAVLVSWLSEEVFYLKCKASEAHPLVITMTVYARNWLDIPVEKPSFPRTPLELFPLASYMRA